MHVTLHRILARTWANRMSQNAIYRTLLIWLLVSMSLIDTILFTVRSPNRTVVFRSSCARLTLTLCPDDRELHTRLRHLHIRRHHRLLHPRTRHFLSLQRPTRSNRRPLHRSAGRAPRPAFKGRCVNAEPVQEPGGTVVVVGGLREV
jgi:hypothetical protein